MNEKGKGSFTPIILVFLVSFLIAGLWDKIPAIKNTVCIAFDPSAGALLDWNLTIGMLIIILIISVLTTLIQKYATDQKTLKELKKDQKAVQKQMKEFRSHPEKLAELQKKQFSAMPQQMKLSMRSIIYTGIPFILLFRWFNDYFMALSAVTGEPVRFFGFVGWFIFYLVFTIVFSSILKKWIDVV